MKITKLGNNLMTIETANAIVLVSYTTPVAAWLRNERNGFHYLRCVEKFSTTTTKHINGWLRTCATVPITACAVVLQSEISALLEAAPAKENEYYWNKLVKQHQAEIDCLANDNLKAMDLMRQYFPTAMNGGAA